MSATTDRVTEVVRPLVDELGAELYDVEFNRGTLRVTLDRPGGLDMGLITAATRRISATLDDADAVPGSYTLEVSSPGLERSLRTPAHFARAVGERVKIKTHPGVVGDRRCEGELLSTAGTSITVACGDGTQRTFELDQVQRASTVVDWSNPPRPGGPETTENEASR